MRVNLGLGLWRMSVVWFGFLGLAALLGAVLLAVQYPGDAGYAVLIGCGGVAAAFVCHKLAAWVLRGMFPASF